MGKASAVESRDSIEKATQKAKMNIVKIMRGCGSWQCGCDENHSIKYKTYGKCGSVRVELLPAPKGVGLATDVETRKILRLAGIKDMWIKTYGNTSARINLASATFDALKKLYIYERQAAAEEVEQVADVEGETVVEAKVEEEQEAKKILEEAKKEVEDVEKEAEEDEAAEEELEKEGEAEGLVGAESEVETKGEVE
jgi:ribosomal protein S5